MNIFMQRLVERFHDHFISILPPSNRAPGELAVVNSLAQKKRMEANRDNEGSLGNVKALTFKARDAESDGKQASDGNATKTEGVPPSDANERVRSCGKGKLPGKKSNLRKVRSKTWRTLGDDDDAVVTSKSSEDSKLCTGNTNSAPPKMHHSNESDLQVEEQATNIVPNPETDSLQSMEFSSYIENTPNISISNLLEEIEADLSSSYSLANNLDYTLHTVNNVRTFARLSRVGIGLALAEEPPEKTESKGQNLKSKLKNLQEEAFVQKTLIDQADKIVKLCRIRKKSMECEDVESIKVLLLAKLRHHILNLEIQKIRLSGEKSREENFGALSMTDIFFPLNELQNFEAGYFICIVYQKEELFASNVKSEIVNRKLHFPVDFKFQQLEKNFIIHIELYRIICKTKSKKEQKMSDLKKAMKKVTQLKAKNCDNRRDEQCFTCIGSASLQLEDVTNRQMGRVSINFHTGFDMSFTKTISICLQTRVFLNQKLTGFLNMFKSRCWYRLWCCQVDYSILFWNYPEDKENEKEPFESVYLPHCSDVYPVSMDICIRPHSFILTFKDGSGNILLSAGSQKDMINWINRLKSCIQCFQAWTPDS